MKTEEVKKIIKSWTTADVRHSYSHHKLSDHDLKRRITDEGIFGASILDLSDEEVLETVKSHLLDETYQTPECIAQWVNDDSDGDNFVEYKEMDTIVGHCFLRYDHDWDKGAIPCSNIAIVLKKIERRYDTTFDLMTIYAEPTDEQKAEYR